MTCRRVTAAASFICLATLGIATPMPTFRSLELFEREDQPEVCAYLFDNTEESQRAIWDKAGLGAGTILEGWLVSNGEEDWLNRIDEDLYAIGESSMWCNGLGGSQCPEPDSCTKYADKGIPQLYYILKAAKIDFELTNHVNDWLQTSTIQNILSINDIEEKFGDKFDHSTIWSATSAAVITGAGLGGLAGGPWGAIGTLGIGAVSFGGAFQKEAVDSSQSMTDVLGAIFTALSEGLRVNLNLAMTGRDSKTNKKTSDLPGLTGVWSQNISKYFDGGRWLISNIEGVMQPVLDEMGKYMKRAVVNAVLKDQEYIIFVDTDIDNKEDCEKHGNAKLWADDSCADFWKLDKPEDGEKDPVTKANGGHNDEIEAMEEDKYGAFDFVEMYENAIACARDHPDGDGQVDVSNWPTDKSVPKCLYNYGVLKGKRAWAHGTWYLCVDGDEEINTTGRRAATDCDEIDTRSI